MVAKRSWGREVTLNRAKLKAASKKNKYICEKKHFKNLLGKSPKVRDKPISKIINNQQDIKIGQFTQDVHLVLTKIKKSKTTSLEIQSVIWYINLVWMDPYGTSEQIAQFVQLLPQANHRNP